MGSFMGLGQDTYGGYRSCSCPKHNSRFKGYQVPLGDSCPKPIHDRSLREQALLLEGTRVSLPLSEDGKICLCTCAISHRTAY